MRERLENKCELLANNYVLINKKYKWNSSINNRLGALLYVMDNRGADLDAIDRCRKIIKENTGVFSQFKDITNFMSAVMLALQPDPEVMFKSTLNVYDAMKREGFHSSPYLVLAAISIALQTDPYDYQKITRSAKAFYDAMKQEHRFLTSSDDYGFASLLAMTHRPVDQVIKESENCYRILKGDFFSSNAVQALSHILAFSDEDAYTKCKRVSDLNKELKLRKCKIGQGIELSFLGICALLKEDVYKLADEIAQASEYLKDKKGFGGWTVTGAERTMYAAAVVCDDYLTDTKHSAMEMALSSNAVGIILAEQMAVMVASSSAASAAAAASSSSNT